MTPAGYDFIGRVRVLLAARAFHQETGPGHLGAGLRGSIRSSANFMRRRMAVSLYRPFIERFGSFDLQGIDFSTCEIQLRRARFLSSERMTNHGACFESVTLNIMSRALE